MYYLIIASSSFISTTRRSETVVQRNVDPSAEESELYAFLRMPPSLLMLKLDASSPVTQPRYGPCSWPRMEPAGAVPSFRQWLPITRSAASGGRAAGADLLAEVVLLPSENAGMSNTGAVSRPGLPHCTERGSAGAKSTLHQ